MDTFKKLRLTGHYSEEEMTRMEEALHTPPFILGHSIYFCYFQIPQTTIRLSVFNHVSEPIGQRWAWSMNDPTKTARFLKFLKFEQAFDLAPEEIKEHLIFNLHHFTYFDSH